MINLRAAGLNETEAKVYTTLLSKKEWKPAELAKNVGESRTNTYKILDNLVYLDLAEKYEKNKKFHYRSANPTRLLQLAQEIRADRQQNEKELELSAHNLLNEYIKTQEQPGIRFYIGKEQIEQVYQDQVNDAKPIYFMLSPKAIDFYGFKTMHNIRLLAAKAHIPRYAITPDNSAAPADYHKADKHYCLTRTWLEKNDYTAPFEWGVYGDKVYFVTFGEDAMGMIIESRAMALGFMQIYKLIDKNQRAQKKYSELPRLPKLRASEYADTIT